MDALTFLKLACGTGRIVPSSEMTEFQICEARQRNLFYVEPGGGLGWRIVPWELTTRRDRERERQYFEEGGK